jgi:DNA-directed RNA polymerase subunit RPC12/RpoP
MASKKTKKPKPSKSRNMKKKPVRKPILTDNELKKIQKELRESRTKSILIENDIRRMRDRLTASGLAAAGSRPTDILTKNFVFKCGKCVEEFKHKAKIDSIEHKVICPKCNKEHILHLKPMIGGYHIIKIPATIKQIK